MRPRGFPDVRWWAAFALGLLFLLPAQAADDSKLTIRTLSNRADLISDGDALVEIKAAAGVDATKAMDYAKTSGAQAALDKADADAQAIGADSTPTFTIKQGNGAEKVLVVGATGLQEALDQALKA